MPRKKCPRSVPFTQYFTRAGGRLAGVSVTKIGFNGKKSRFFGKKRCDIEFVRPRRRCALAGLSSTRGRSQRPFVEKLASVAPIGSLSRSKQRGNGPLLSHGDLLGRVALPRRFVDTSKKPDGFINPAGDEAARVKICKKWSELTSLLLGGERSIMEYMSRNGCE